MDSHCPVTSQPGIALLERMSHGGGCILKLQLPSSSVLIGRRGNVPKMQPMECASGETLLIGFG